MFFLLCITSQLALFLFFIQTFWGDQYPDLFLISIHVFALIQFYFCNKYYSKLRYLFLLWFAVLSIWHMAMYLYADKSILYFIVSFILLGISLVYYYQNKDQLCSALSAVGLGISFTLIIVKAVTEWFGQNEIVELFFIALIIFAWFAFITYMLIKFIPHSRFNAIPLAVGAWIAGIVFATLMLTFWGNFSLLMGVVFVALAAYLLKAKQSLFLRQFAYCLWVAGQIAVIFHTVDLMNHILPILFLQLAMLSRLLKAKIHRCVVTQAELHYEGSCAIDGLLLDLAGIREYEEIHMWNVTNGKRFSTYAIRGEEGSGIISVNGGAAHQADVGDLMIIATFGDFTEAEANAHKPRLVYANPDNTVSHMANCIPVQVA